MSTKEPNAILRGAQPGQTTEAERLYVVADDATELKIDLGNCYDHFVVTAERAFNNGRECKVFTWIDRTYVAE
jgi:hypothetical protein